MNTERIRQSIRRRGVAGTVAQGLRQVMSLPRQRRALRQERAFDAAHGVETAGIVRLHGLKIDSPNVGEGTRYEAIPPEAFHDVIEGLPVEGWTFVDFGAGKGRALMLASLYPFKRIVGVEFSPELADEARRNVATFSHPDQKCREFEVVTADAATWRLPDEPLLIYMFNPFEPPLLRQVLAMLKHRQLMREHPMNVAVANLVVAPQDVEDRGFRALDASGARYEA